MKKTNTATSFQKLLKTFNIIFNISITYFDIIVKKY